MRLIVVAAYFGLLFGCSKKNISDEYDKEVSALATYAGEDLPFLVGKDFRPEWNLRDQPAREMMSFKLHDQKGKPVHSENLTGKVTIVSFFYSKCPGICPMTTKNLKIVQQSFAKNDRVKMISFSLTPDHDSPKVLEKFARRYKINPNRWHLLTGPKQEIYRLARESFDADTFSAKENTRGLLTKNDFLHSENVYLVDQNHKIRGVYSGLMTDSLAQMSKDVEKLLK